MPLHDFIAEVMVILKTQPTVTEICVKNVIPFRFADEGGQEKYEQVFQGLNSSMTSGAGTDQ